jgi:hypothetical protein
MNNESWLTAIALLRKFLEVPMILILPRIDLIPARCSLKIVKSTDLPGDPKVDSGG